MPDDRPRCEWPGADEAMLRYHDEVWGVPMHDDRQLFEFITLEGAQAGLSWSTILGRVEGYRHAFLEWDIEAIAAMDEADVERLRQDTGIIRNRAKIQSTISNAQAVLDLLPQWTTLDRYIWQFVDEVTVINEPRRLDDIEAETEQSQAMSKQLKRDGFRFVGPTICYAFMQAAGLVNDHTVDCFRHAEVATAV
jgi:DNA-3-methyladenine glycosylase I